MSSTKVYQKIINLWDAPKHRIYHLLSQLRPLPRSVDKTGYLCYLNESTTEQIFNCSNIQSSSTDQSSSSDEELEPLSSSSSDDDDYPDIMDRDVVKVMKTMVSQVSQGDTRNLDLADEVILCRNQVNSLAQRIMELKHCSEQDGKPTVDRVLSKKRTQQKLLCQLSRLVGAMTRMSLKESSESVVFDDADLMKLPYKCSRKDRHEKLRKRQHHHDLRRRRERRRRRRRRHHQKKIRQKESSDGSELERVSQRRKRWKEMEALDNERMQADQEAAEQRNQPIAVQMAAINRITAGQTRSTGLESHRPVKVKPKISISLNLSNVSVPVSEQPAEQSTEASAELTNMYSNVKFPYPVINDQRDLNTVAKVLQTKKREIELRLNDAVFQLNTQAETQPNSEAAARLRQNADSLRAQIRRMDTQLDYVQTRREIERLKLTSCRTQKEKEEAKKQIGSLINRMGRLHQTMKESNRQFLRTYLKDHGGPKRHEKSVDDQDALSEPKLKKKKQEDSGLTGIKSKIADLIKGKNNIVVKKKQRKGRETNSPSKVPSQPSHEEFMKMLSADVDLKNKVCSEINALAGDNPVMRALTAEAQKRLEAGGNASPAQKDVDERINTSNVDRILAAASIVTSVAPNKSDEQFQLNSQVFSSQQSVGGPQVVQQGFTGQQILNGQQLFNQQGNQFARQQPLVTQPFNSPFDAQTFSNQLSFNNSQQPFQMFTGQLPLMTQPPPNIRQLCQPNSNQQNDENQSGGTSSESEESFGEHNEDEQKFPFRRSDLAKFKCTVPLQSCGLFSTGYRGSDTDPAGLYWAMNEVSRVLAKMDTKCCIVGGPYVGRSSFTRSTGTSNRIAPFSSLSTLLFTECD